MEDASSSRSAGSRASGARACRFCRVRKIKCDTKRPSCGSCIANKRKCIYVFDPPRKRPSKAIIYALQRERDALQDVLIRLKSGSVEERENTLEKLHVQDGAVQLPSPISISEPGSDPLAFEPDHRPSSATSLHGDETANEQTWIPYAAAEGKELNKPERAEEQYIVLYDPIEAAVTAPLDPVPEHYKYRLTANAALQLQKEHVLRSLDYIRGVPAELAMHLLDLHWNRQHHTFHLTYRPLFMRELVDGGPYCTDFLLNAVFASSSKFSERPEVHNDNHFFIRCEELIAQQSLLTYSSIPTIMGLLLLGATFNARGSSSKGWLYTGYALRMVYDLGLHLDTKVLGTAEDAEQVELRRRVFWAAFCVDKMQSLYHGRSAYIEIRDSNVSRNFMDTIEELEPWNPYFDPQSTDNGPNSRQRIPPPIHSVSTFQNLCTLCMIMTRIINHFYIVGSTKENTQAEINSIDRTLSSWYQRLPPHLVFEPSSNPQELRSIPAPNVIILLTTYNALIIVLHRPFISKSDLKSTAIPANSWKKCTAAARNITNLVLAYASTYPLRRSSYLLSYAVYVACTIHVRNIAKRQANEGEAEFMSPLVTCLRFLDVLSLPNGGVNDLASIIRRLMVDNGIPQLDRVPDTPDFNFLGASAVQQFEPVSTLFGDPAYGFGDLSNLAGFHTVSQDLLFGVMNDTFSSGLVSPNDLPVVPM